MKAGKILIIMIIVTQGFSANAQRAGNNYNSVDQYSRALDLSEDQVNEWAQLNDDYDNEYANVNNDESLTKKERRKQRKQLRNDKSNKLKGLLSPRQYRGYQNLSYNNFGSSRFFGYGNRFGYGSRFGFASSRFGYGSRFGYSRFGRRAYCRY